MKPIYLFLYSFIVLSFMSCNEDKLPIEKLGEVKYYDSFWPCPADTTSLTKTFIFDFNADAKAKGDKAFAEFAFVDLEGNPVPTKELRIEKDGKALDHNQFKVTSAQPEVTLKFTYLPAAKSGTHQGMLRLVSSGGIERICSSEITAGQQLDLFKWDIKFKKSWNPLALGMVGLFLFFLFLCIVWFLFIRPQVVKRLKIFNLSVIEPYFTSIPVNGSRKVVFTSRPQKQGVLNRIFMGKIIYEINPVWEHEWILEPLGDGAMISAPNYNVNPLDTPLELGVEYKLEDDSAPKNKAKISVN